MDEWIDGETRVAGNAKPQTAVTRLKIMKQINSNYEKKKKKAPVSHPALRRGQAGLWLRSPPAAGVHGSGIPERRRGTAHIHARILLPQSPAPVFTARELQQPLPSSLFTARPHGCRSGRVLSCPLGRVNPITMGGGSGGAAGAGRSARERSRRCRSARRTPRGGQRAAERRGRPRQPARSKRRNGVPPARERQHSAPGALCHLLSGKGNTSRSPAGNISKPEARIWPLEVIQSKTLPRQGYREQVTQEHIQVRMNWLQKGRRPSPPEQSVPILSVQLFPVLT